MRVLSFDVPVGAVSFKNVGKAYRSDSPEEGDDDSLLDRIVEVNRLTVVLIWTKII